MYEVIYQFGKQGGGFVGGDVTETDTRNFYGDLYVMADNQVGADGAQDTDEFGADLVEMLDRFFSKGDWR